MDAILTIHSVDDSGSVLSIAPSDLERLVEALLASDVEFTSVTDITNGDSAERNRVALTFDDGLESVHRHALPLVERLRVPATVYVVADWVGRDNGWPGQPAAAPRFELMDWAHLDELRDVGFEIGSHTANHVHLRGLSADDYETELGGAKRTLEDRMQVPIRSFAYPYGTHDAESAAAVGGWYSNAVTTRMAYLGPQADPLRLPRLDVYYLRGSLSIRGGGL